MIDADERRQAQNPATITGIMAITLREQASGEAWRKRPNDGVERRTRLFLRTFKRFFDFRQLDQFLFICPRRDFAAVSTLVRESGFGSKFRVLDELEVCPDIVYARNPKSRKPNGYFIQQLLKLAIAERVETSHYLTFDNDIACLQSFTLDDLFVDGRARLNCESMTDYERIYTREAAQREYETKVGRNRASAEKLRYTRPGEKAGEFWGETPVLMHTQSVRSLFEYLSNLHGKSWSRFLAENLSWGEYSLYFQFLEMSGNLARTYCFSDCNSILDLEKSVWHASADYRDIRPYDWTHFQTPHPHTRSGPFVAIQSWLSVWSWLPFRCSSLDEFYRELDSWLLG